MMVAKKTTKKGSPRKSATRLQKISHPPDHQYTREELEAAGLVVPAESCLSRSGEIDWNFYHATQDDLMILAAQMLSREVEKIIRGRSYSDLKAGAVFGMDMESLELWCALSVRGLLKLADMHLQKNESQLARERVRNAQDLWITRGLPFDILGMGITPLERQPGKAKRIAERNMEELLTEYRKARGSTPQAVSDTQLLRRLAAPYDDDGRSLKYGVKEGALRGYLTQWRKSGRISPAC